MRALAFAAVLAGALAVGVPAAAAEGSGAGEQGVGAAKATAAADRDPKVVEQRRLDPDLRSSAHLEDGRWEVAYFSGDEQVALAIVDRESGAVEESWTGYQVAWKMARGYSGAFGHKLNAPYVFLPIAALFLLGLFDWRRLWRAANLDLLALLGFAISHYFFNRAEIGVSVPLVYPFLLYLMARALWIGFGGRGRGIRPVWSATVLLVAALFLMGVRVGLNLADAGAIDVGYAGVVGADRVTHGEPIYDNFPEDVSQGDTYGPVNYVAYVPSELVWPWSGSWDDLPAAHGAAVAFDLLAFALLFLLGRRIRPGPEGLKLASTLAFGWASYPYTAYVLESNSNDSLVAVLLIATLLVLARPVARGAFAALATFAKFVPGLLVPMLFTYRPPGDPSSTVPSAGGRERGGAEDAAAHSAPPRSPSGPATGRFVLGFVLVSVLVMAWPAIDPGLKVFYERTIEYQADRDSPFSIWGQVGLEPLRLAIAAAVAVLALALALRPRRKTLTQVAALGAALIIGAQLTAQHWFYLYIVWFFPLLLVAAATVTESEREPEPARRSPPVPAG